MATGEQLWIWMRSDSSDAGIREHLAGLRREPSPLFAWIEPRPGLWTRDASGAVVGAMPRGYARNQTISVNAWPAGDFALDEARLWWPDRWLHAVAYEAQGMRWYEFALQRPADPNGWDEKFVSVVGPNPLLLRGGLNGADGKIQIMEYYRDGRLLTWRVSGTGNN